MVTVNVNGLGSPRRVAALLHFLCVVCRSPDIVFLQELKVADASALSAALTSGRGQGLPYHCACYAQCGTRTARGVAILVKMNACLPQLPDAPAMSDADGRIVRVDLHYCGQPVSLLSVYAPNTGRAGFFESLHSFLPAAGACIVGGDFNCILDGADQTSGGGSRFDGAPALRQLLSSYELSDAFRHTHPSVREYTHVATTRLSAARLDRVYVSQHCLPWVQHVEHAWGSPGDHAAVIVDLWAPGQPAIGPGLPCFPSFVLFHDSYRQQLFFFFSLGKFTRAWAKPKSQRRTPQEEEARDRQTMMMMMMMMMIGYSIEGQGMI